VAGASGDLSIDSIAALPGDAAHVGERAEVSGVVRRFVAAAVEVVRAPVVH